MNRRGFLAGLLSAIAAPAIVRAGLIMPIKNYDVFHDVIIKGIGIYGEPIEEIIRVPETLKDGLDMGFYAEKTSIVRPKYNLVDSIIWNKAMPLKRVIEPNGWSLDELKKLDDGTKHKPSLLDEFYISEDQSRPEFGFIKTPHTILGIPWGETLRETIVDKRPSLT